MMRNFRCQFYERCLTEAARAGSTMHCDGCRYELNEAGTLGWAILPMSDTAAWTAFDDDKETAGKGSVYCGEGQSASESMSTFMGACTPTHNEHKIIGAARP